MGSVGFLAKGDIFFWQSILKNWSKYTGDISEQSVVCTVLITAIIIEIFRKNKPISYIIPYKNLASPLIPVCLEKSHMTGTLLHVTVAFGWFRSDFPRAIDSYDTQTHTGTRPPVDLMWPSIIQWRIMTHVFTSHPEKEKETKERGRESDRERER